ncbi:secreted lipase like protein [Verticillium longisporum]|uniref:Secreted lipase like protein n=1 Tax=Verticillium longisporum TaxID=100787 RepID=A0A8I3AVC3_VERLO|nr:secreted lipase like protein [Verticillium longisporum]
MHFPQLAAMTATLFGQALAHPQSRNDNFVAEVPSTRSYFMIAGGYVDDGAGGHIFSPSDQGYEVYIVDQTFRGRSACMSGNGAAKASTYTPPRPSTSAFTAAEDNHLLAPGPVQAAGAALLGKIGRPVILVGHSPRAASCPLLITDARPELTEALHQGRQLANRADKPTLVVTAEASYHMPYDYCTVDFLRRAGCSGTRHVELADEGIRGNGYRFFVAKNSDVIQRLPEKWISAQ